MMIILLINELFFWLHFGLLTFAVISGLLLPLPVIVLLIIAHRLHIWFFGGCLFSKLQEKFGGIPKNTSFIQVVVNRLFGTSITQQQSHFADYCLVVATLVIGITHYLNPLVKLG